MKKIRRGWALTKKSWALLNDNRELIRFPLYGAVATIVPAILFLGPGLYLFDRDELAGAIPLVVVGVYALSVIGFYFSVGLAACADMIFRGQQATVADGLAVARERFSQICGWAAVNTAISAVMGALENQGGIGGQIAAGVALWSSASFLGALLVVIGALVLAIAMLISKALSGIFGVALYRYALDGETVGGFTQAELESAVKTKGRHGRNAPPTATPGTV